MGLLRRRTAWDAAAWLNEQAHKRFRPYSVLFGSPEGFYYFSPQNPPIFGDSPAPLVLRPGMYALSNSTLDDRTWPKVERSHAFLEQKRGVPGEALLEELQRFLCDPTPTDDQPTLVAGEEIHGAEGAVFIRSPGYGTVSSSILTAGGKLGERYYYAESSSMERSARDALRGHTFQTPFRQIQLTVPPQAETPAGPI
jgi:uncharacterized protein with NRDE domain